MYSKYHTTASICLQLDNSIWKHKLVGFIKFEKCLNNQQEALKYDTIWTDYPNNDEWKYYYRIKDNAFITNPKDRIIIKGSQTITKITNKKTNAMIKQLMNKYIIDEKIQI